MHAAELRVGKRERATLSTLTVKRSDKRIPEGTWRGPIAALVIWSFWTILPAALLNDSQMRAAAAVQLGTSVVAYLRAAPP